MFIAWSIWIIDSICHCILHVEMKQYKEKPRKILEIKLIHGGREEDGLNLKLSFMGNSLF